MTGLLPVLARNGLFTRPERTAIDRFFEGWGPELRTARARWMPSLEVRETEETYVVEAEVPGLAKEDIDITLTDDLLTIQGEKKVEQEEDRGDMHMTERRYGSFARTLRLPGTIDTAKVTAATKDGVLTVTIPKAEEEKPRKIEVRD